MIYIIGITVYLLSLWLVRRYIKIAHSDEGIWSKLDIEMPDLLMTILPLINTMAVIYLCFLGSPVKKDNKPPINYNRFFK